MAKYHYKRYLDRAFWNSFLSFSVALVTLFILLIVWQFLKPMLVEVYSDVTGIELEEDPSTYDLERYLNERTDLTEEQKSRILKEANTPPSIEGDGEDAE